jgi:hypothetical protein
MNRRHRLRGLHDFDAPSWIGKNTRMRRTIIHGSPVVVVFLFRSHLRAGGSPFSGLVIDATVTMGRSVAGLVVSSILQSVRASVPVQKQANDPPSILSAVPTLTTRSSQKSAPPSFSSARAGNFWNVALGIASRKPRAPGAPAHSTNRRFRHDVIDVQVSRTSCTT